MRTPLFFLLLALLLLPPTFGCGSSDEESTPVSTTGLVTVSAMDDPAVDVGTFALAVGPFTLHGPAGERAPVLAGPAVVDFAAATRSAVFLAAADVPAGTYTAAEVELDFATLDARRTDGTPLEVYDEAGQARLQTRLQVRLRLEVALSVGPQDPAHLMLDFQLGQSLEPVPGVPNRVRLRPLLQVRTQAEMRVQTRFEGELVDVDPPGAAPGFTVDVEPADGGAAVRLRFEANEQTACNGRHGAGQGDQGLQLMETCLQERVMVTARVRAGQDEFAAEEVCFGGHVPGDAVDVAMGFVADWVGTSYTIIGARLTSGAGAETIGETITAIIDGTSSVLMRGGAAGPADIGVGQHVMVAGTLTPGTPPVLDCTGSGSVRLLETGILGLVVSTTIGAPDSRLTMQLTHFAQYPVALFELAGHGADPLAYDVVTTADLTGLQVGDAIVCRGFVLGVGAAADFEAVEVALQEPTDSVLSVSWALPGTAAPFGGGTAFPLTLDLTGTYLAEVASQHGTVVVPLTGAPSLQVPPGGAQGPFAIREGGEITLYDGADAASWLADLNVRLGGGRLAVRLTGLGDFADGVPQVYTANSLSITVR